MERLTPEQVKEIDKLYLEKCQEVNDLIEILLLHDSDVVCDRLCRWKADGYRNRWCSKNCSPDGPKRECYMEYLNMKKHFRKDCG